MSRRFKLDFLTNSRIYCFCMCPRCSSGDLCSSADAFIMSRCVMASPRCRVMAGPAGFASRLRGAVGSSFLEHIDAKLVSELLPTRVISTRVRGTGVGRSKPGRAATESARGRRRRWRLPPLTYSQPLGPKATQLANPSAKIRPRRTQHRHCRTLALRGHSVPTAAATAGKVR